MFFSKLKVWFFCECVCFLRVQQWNQSNINLKHTKKFQHEQIQILLNSQFIIHGSSLWYCWYERVCYDVPAVNTLWQMFLVKISSVPLSQCPGVKCWIQANINGSVNRHHHSKTIVCTLQLPQMLDMEYVLVLHIYLLSIL